MSFEMVALPFHVKTTFYRVYGLLRLEQRQIVLEFQSVENIIGILKTKIKTAQIPLTEITEISLTKGRWGSHHLQIRVLHLDALKRFPGPLQGGCVLTIRRGDQLLAETLVSQLELARIEAQYKKWDEPDTPLLGVNEQRIEMLKTTWKKIKEFIDKA